MTGETHFHSLSCSFFLPESNFYFLSQWLHFYAVIWPILKLIGIADETKHQHIRHSTRCKLSQTNGCPCLARTTFKHISFRLPRLLISRGQVRQGRNVGHGFPRLTVQREATCIYPTTDGVTASVANPDPNRTLHSLHKVVLVFGVKNSAF
jgi:hypothetical protein